MDKIFKSIGRFFKSIWEWIKTTAWVQPLLIVIIVFTIIFSFSAQSPLMKWIKSLSNPDQTGEFYKAHKVDVKDIFDDVYSSTPKYGVEKGKLPDGKTAGKYLTDTSYTGYSYVLFINSDAQESTFRQFHDTLLKTEEEKKHFYVVDFRDENNLKSEYNVTKGAWENDDGKVIYNYLLTKIYHLYDSKEYTDFSDEFQEKKGYGLKFQEEWQISSDLDKAKDELKYPTICKFQGTTLVDFRFADNLESNYHGDGISGNMILDHFVKGLN